MPAGKRKIDPVSTGIPMSHPISALLKLYACWSTRNVTSTPYIIHTAKQTVNAVVFAVRTLMAFARVVMNAPRANRCLAASQELGLYVLHDRPYLVG